MITVYGDHFSTSSLCRFGTLTPTPATFISSTQVLCESSTMEVGYHHLAISNNPFDWSVPGLPFEFMNTSSSVLSRVSPTSGPFWSNYPDFEWFIPEKRCFNGFLVRDDYECSWQMDII